MRTHSLAAVLAVLTACGSATVNGPVDELADFGSSLVDGEPRAVAVLRFLADASATEALLDGAVGLDSRAAAALVAHRDGADKVRGTADDDAFDTLAEVDAIAYVGTVALDKLAAYAEAHGFLQPPSSEPTVTIEGVTFTAAQEAATLAFANTASLALLDATAKLDSRAAANIIAARPIATMAALARISYVGTVALGKLKAAAPALPTGPAPGSAGSDCVATAGCNAGLYCVGFAGDDEPVVIGKCQDSRTRIPGRDLACDLSTPCGPNLVCAGTTFEGDGTCRPAWMAGTFTSIDAAQAIPDGGAAVQSTVLVYGLASVPEDIVAHLRIDHPRKQDLVVRLIAHDGSAAILWDHEASPSADVAVTSGMEFDHYVNHTFTLEVQDTVGGSTGTLQGFTLDVTSRFD